MFDYDFGMSPLIDRYLEEAHAWWDDHIWLNVEIKRQVENQCIDVDSL